MWRTDRWAKAKACISTVLQVPKIQISARWSLLENASLCSQAIAQFKAWNTLCREEDPS